MRERCMEHLDLVIEDFMIECAQVVISRSPPLSNRKVGLSLALLTVRSVTGSSHTRSSAHSKPHPRKREHA